MNHPCDLTPHSRHCQVLILPETPCNICQSCLDALHHVSMHVTIRLPTCGACPNSQCTLQHASSTRTRDAAAWFALARCLHVDDCQLCLCIGTECGGVNPHVCLQVVLGQALHQVDELLPSSSLPFDDIAAAILLVFFGVRTLQVRPCCCNRSDDHMFA